MATTKTHSTQEFKEINPLLAGALLGAGVGVVSAVALNHKQTRAKAQDVAKVVGEKASEFFQNVKEDATLQLEEKAKETTEEVRKVISAPDK